ncbi:MAG: hypothetical protein ABEJ56_04675 [Candidatus Nanohaloarchaea archaeon]
MTNEFMEAIKEDDGDEDSSERFRKLKKQQAGTEKNKAEKRYEQLKEEAKQEFIEKQEKRDEESESEEEDDTFVTY